MENICLYVSLKKIYALTGMQQYELLKLIIIGCLNEGENEIIVNEQTLSCISHN